MSEIVKKFNLEPTNFSEAVKFAELLASSSFVPTQYRGKPSDILVAVQMGMELGLKPLQALQNIALINGKPSVYGDALLALVKSHPQFENIEEFMDGDTAVCIVKRVGQSPCTSKFSKENAMRAKLWGKVGPWTDYPHRMLQMRARGFCLRDAFPDALKGIITKEEAQDFPPEKDFKSQEVENKTIDIKIDSNLEDPEEKKLLVEQLGNLINIKNIPDSVIQKWLEKAEVENIEELSKDRLIKCIEHLQVA